MLYLWSCLCLCCVWFVQQTASGGAQTGDCKLEETWLLLLPLLSGSALSDGSSLSGQAEQTGQGSEGWAASQQTTRPCWNQVMLTLLGFNMAAWPGCFYRFPNCACVHVCVFVCVDTEPVCLPACLILGLSALPSPETRLLQSKVNLIDKQTTGRKTQTQSENLL